MKAIFKYFFLFIFAIIAIVAANMAYDYIKLCYWSNAVEQVVEDFSLEV